MLIFMLFLATVESKDSTDMVPLVGEAGHSITIPCKTVLDNIQGIIWYRHDEMLVSYNPKTKTKKDIIDLPGVSVNEDFSLTLSDLKVSDTSNYTCKMMINQDTSIIERNATRQLIVKGVPGKPEKPNITEVLSRWLKVSWQPTTVDNNSPIISYIVQIKSASQVWSERRSLIVGSIFNSTKISELHPHTQYEVRIFAKNAIGRSISSDPSDMHYTLPEAPGGPPVKILATSISSSVIRVQWEQPFANVTNGILGGYELIYGVKGEDTVQPISVIDPQKKVIDLYGLRPYTVYSIIVKAFNKVGTGPGGKITISTIEGVPTKPRITHISSTKSHSLVVNWLAPSTLNGKLRNYQLHWLHNGTDMSKNITQHLSDPMSAQITGLNPYTEYKIKVAARTGGGLGEFSDVYPALTDVSGPSAPSILNLTVLSPTSVYVQWDPPEVVNRDVDGYIIKLATLDDLKVSKREIKAETEEVLTELATNHQYALSIAGVIHSIFSDHKHEGNFSESVVFELQEINFVSLSKVYRLTTPFGGPVMVTESHTVMNVSEENFTVKSFLGPRNSRNSGEVRAFGNHRDSTDMEIEEEDDVLTAGIVAGIVSTIIILLIIVLVSVSFRSITCRQYYQAAYNYLAVPSHSQSSPPTIVTVAETYESWPKVNPSTLNLGLLEEAEHPAIPFIDFIPHVERLHADSDIGFSQQFDDISQRTRVDLKSENSALPENRLKNRYINIAAFDHTRVPLKPLLSRQRHSDYINANYIDGYNKSKAYIATQGPLPQTVDEFWRMVWEQNSAVIVMITNLMERGRRKCDQYWPNEGTEEYGIMSVRLLSTFSRAHYTVRIFSLRNQKKRKKHSAERVVYQYHYTEWPDHGVPDYTLPVLTFVRKSAAANPPGAGPIVVHCSAGVGRTGTYILIDSMIQQIKDKGSVNVAGFLLHIRQQRNFLVQTEDQYMFVHDVLVEYILGGGDTEIQDAKIMRYFEELMKCNERGESQLDRQYHLCTCHKTKEHEFSQSLKPVNQSKNMAQDILPVDMKRVLLSVKPGVEGSDYINASYLQGYNRTDEFIITQHPLEGTVEDFWRMVWDQNSAAIVMLSRVDGEEFKEFWPEKGDSIQVDAGNFKLFHREEDNSSDPATRDFIMESTQDDYVLMSRIIATTTWPANCTSLHSVFDFIEICRRWYQQYNSGPIIVIDSFGGVEAARFCALWALFDQLQHDKAIDVYQLSKLYHLKRPGIVGTKDDYYYLYKVLDSLCKYMAEKEKEKETSRTATIQHHGTAIRNGIIPNSNSGPRTDV